MKVEFYNASGEVTGTYRKLKNLRFAPTANIINERVPIDYFEVDIVTDVEHHAGRRAGLKDEDDNLWFWGYVTYAEHEDDGIEHLRVESELLYLDKKMMKARMYEEQSLYGAIANLLLNTKTEITMPQDVILDKVVNGYCPKQTARERLQQILFASGLYIKSSFVEHPTLAKVPNGVHKIIPVEKTYWRPKLMYDDYVTSVTVTSFKFTEGTPTDDDEYVKVDGTTYVITRNDVTLTNQDPSIPSTAPSNEVVIDNIGLVNNANVDTVASQLAQYYFNRLSVDLDVINNHEYFTGRKYTVHLAPDDTDGTVYQATGYAFEMDFTFGREAKSRVLLGGCDMQPTHRVRLNYVSAESEVSEGMLLGRRTYHFPEGYQYTVTNPYLRSEIGNYIYIWRPESETYTGTMPDSNVEVSVNCYIALKKNKKTGVLEVRSVDAVERNAYGSGADQYYVAEID